MNIVPLITLSAVGAVTAGQLNRAIYSWAWDSRQISPWSKKPENAAPRTWSDCLPVFGWWQLRRESKLHGKGFWIRPAFIELAWTIGLPLFYWWSVVRGGQLVLHPPAAAWLGSLQATFLSNSVLLALMTIATFIDFDEKTIPDSVTIPGTLTALTLVTLLPHSLLPIGVPPEPILLMKSVDWPAWLHSPALPGLWIGLGCWIGWCLALLPYTVYFRRGLVYGLKLLIGSVLHKRRRIMTAAIAAMCCVGIVAITCVWQFGELRWQALLSSLVGMAAAGGLVWSIRLVAGGVLGVEAMGFGDVTLMFMIGAFFGWQASMICFFLAPFTSIGIAAAQWLITGDRRIAFGPFLCAGACILMFCWVDIWQGFGQLFQGEMALILVGSIVICILLMGIMLAVLQVIKRVLGFA